MWVSWIKWTLKISLKLTELILEKHSIIFSRRDSLCEEKRQTKPTAAQCWAPFARVFFRNTSRGRKIIWSVSKALFDAYCSFPELWHDADLWRELAWSGIVNFTECILTPEPRTGAKTSTKTALNINLTSSLVGLETHHFIMIVFAGMTLVMLMLQLIMMSSSWINLN